MTAADDIAATQTVPNCRNALELMDRLEIVNNTDPYEARKLYFTWRALAHAIRQHPGVWTAVEPVGKHVNGDRSRVAVSERTT